VKIVREGTDFLEIEADLPAPAILLVTDCWTPAWRAVPLPGSGQSQYDVFPSDYVLRGIPLAEGQHSLRMEYAPSGFRVGAWLSLAGWTGLFGVVGWLVRNRR
jgi:hypothetical protein